MENINANAVVENEENPSKLIFNAQLAKYLVEEKGFTIIGLKANKDNRDKTVFVFPDSLSLRNSMQEYTKARRKARAERAKAGEADADDEKEPILQED